MDDPRLSARFGHDPAGLAGHKSQRDGPEADGLQPTVRRDPVLSPEPQHQEEHEHEVSAQRHHYVKRVEGQAYGRDQLGWILDIPIAEVGEVLLQHSPTGAHGLLILRRECLAIVSQRCDGEASAGDAFLDRERPCARPRRVSTLDQVRDARNERVQISLCQIRQRVGDLHLHHERIRTVSVRLLSRIQYAHGHQPRTVRALIQALHGGQLHGLKLRHVIR